MIGKKPDNQTHDIVEANAQIMNSQFIQDKPQFDTDLIRAINEQYRETTLEALRNVVNTTGNLSRKDVEEYAAELRLLQFLESETQYPAFMKQRNNVQEGVLNTIISEINLSKNIGAGFLRSFTEQTRKIFTGKLKKKSALQPGDEQ